MKKTSLLVNIATTECAIIIPMKYYWAQSRMNPLLHPTTWMILKYSIKQKEVKPKRVYITLILFIGNLNKDKINLFI